MTGIVSAMADNTVLGMDDLVLAGLGALLSFLVGAAVSSIMVNYSRRRQMHSEFAFPLLLEAFLLLCFGILGARLADIDVLFISVTVMLLCFIMGLQNATITKLSKSEIRTTHITGIVTDIGIELGKLMYVNSGRHRDLPNVSANKARLAMLFILAASFFAGGVAGAFGFKHIGYVATVPLAMVLVTLAIVPAMDDLLVLLRKIWPK
jgi:uncharacterized membrane protein YoaK (UPF0700 family)